MNKPDAQALKESLDSKAKKVVCPRCKEEHFFIGEGQISFLQRVCKCGELLPVAAEER